ncbi:MerR family transcriptional regulator [Microbacteriaceae bacterium VKM Ac-2855]|nr:MerR family transcriptional regulator [Microbacteriaceae bacterium VKM Ac-2855]
MKDLIGADGAEYGIAGAAARSGVGEQTLRLYEEKGLITPRRTGGGTRRYSDADLDQVARVTDLVGQGINLAGVGRVLELEAVIAHLRATIAGRRPAFDESE